MRRAIVLSLLLVAATAAAQERKAACFCMVEPISGNIRKGCETMGQGYKSKTVCRGENGEEIDVTKSGAGWTPLTAGEGLCQPCDIKLKIDEGPIRSDEQPASSKTKRDDGSS